jgi:hypothetical protein
MIIIDEDTRYKGENYRAIAAHEDNKEAYLHFLQPLESKLKSQVAHDDALNTLFEREEDLSIRYTSIDYESEAPEYR